MRVGGSGSIVIVGDPHEVDCRHLKLTTLEYLGRRYMLSATLTLSRCIPPEIDSQTGARGWAGPRGFRKCHKWWLGGNLELGTHWKIGPLHDDKGQWIISLLASIETWCLGEREREAITRAKLIPWVEALISAESNEQPPVLYSQPGNTLARQLT